MLSRQIARTGGLSLAFAIAAALPLTAQIGPFAVGVKAGTLGLGAEAALHVAGPLAVRASYTTYTYNRTDDFFDADGKIKAKLSGTSFGVDLHPFSGAFRISGGLVTKTPTGTVDVVNPGDVTLNNHTYTNSQVSAAHIGVLAKKNAPYVSIGFDKSVFSKSRVTFGFELGVVAWDTPIVSASVTSTLTGSAKTTLDNDVAAEVAKRQSDIHDLPLNGKYFPLLAFSLKVRL